MFKRLRARLRARLDGLMEWVTYKLCRKYPNAYRRHRAEVTKALAARIQKLFTLDKQFISKTEMPAQKWGSSGSRVRGRDFCGKDFRPEHVRVAERQARRETLKGFMGEIFSDPASPRKHRPDTSEFEAPKPHPKRIRPLHVYCGGRERKPRPDPLLSPDAWLAEAERLIGNLRTTPMDNHAMAAFMAEDRTPKSAAEMLGRPPRSLSREHACPAPPRRLNRIVPHSARSEACEAFEKRGGTNLSEAEKLLKAGKFELLPDEVRLADFLPKEVRPGDDSDGVRLNEPVKPRSLRDEIEDVVAELERRRAEAEREGRPKDTA